MYYVLYALFMFHPENTNDWRITDQLQFQNGNYQYYDVSDFTDGHELISVREETD